MRITLYFIVSIFGFTPVYAQVISNPDDFIYSTQLHTFDDLAGLNSIVGWLDLDGVSIANSSLIDQPGTMRISSDQDLCISGSCIYTSNNSSWTFIFDSPIHGFGIYATDNNFSSSASMVRYSNNEVIGATNLSDWACDGVSGNCFIGWESSLSEFDQVRLHLAGTANAVYLDNLYVSTVPVPSTLWLLASGVLGLFGFAQRRIYTVK